MITRNGYSKDNSIVPTGIVITWPKTMLQEGGGLESFQRLFEREMKHPDGLWLQKCKNEPKRDIAHVYVIIDGFVKYRVQYAGHERGETIITKANGKNYIVQWPRILMV